MLQITCHFVKFPTVGIRPSNEKINLIRGKKPHSNKSQWLANDAILWIVFFFILKIVQISIGEEQTLTIVIEKPRKKHRKLALHAHNCAFSHYFTAHLHGCCRFVFAIYLNFDTLFGFIDGFNYCILSLFNTWFECMLKHFTLFYGIPLIRSMVGIFTMISDERRWYCVHTNWKWFSFSR